GGGRFLSSFSRPRLALEDIFPFTVIVAMVVLMAQTADWTFQAKLAPLIVCTGVLIFTSISPFNQVFSRGSVEEKAVAAPDGAEAEAELHMDLQSDYTGVETRLIVTRGLTFFAWIAGFMVVMAIAGFIPALVTFVVGYMRSENRERWSLVLTYAAVIAVFVYLVFDQY